MRLNRSWRGNRSPASRAGSAVQSEAPPSEEDEHDVRPRCERRPALCCLIRHQPDYTRTTQALPGGSRSEPVTAGSLGGEMPALAGNSGWQPAVSVEPVPVCHAGGRGFESRRSRSCPAASLSCVRRGWRPRTSLRYDSRVRFVCRENRHTHSVRWTHLVNEEMLRSIQAQLDDGEVATPRAEGSAISLDAAVEQALAASD
jgi:hypothetical protein